MSDIKSARLDDQLHDETTLRVLLNVSVGPSAKQLMLSRRGVASSASSSSSRRGQHSTAALRVNTSINTSMR